MASAPAIRTTPKAMGQVLAKSADKLMAVLPKHLTPERMSQLVTTMMFRTPKLQECDEGSILAAVIAASSLGLDLLPSLQEAFLIPRWNERAKCMECQFQPGYQGLRKLALNTGKIFLLETRLVRRGDVFAYEYAPDLAFQHIPLPGNEAEVVVVYSYAKLFNGERTVEVMTRDQVEEIHRRSESYRKAQKYNQEEVGPWVTDWNEMARKTVLKRHCKSLPRSIELAEAILADDREYVAEVAPEPERKAIPRPATAAGRLAEQIAGEDPDRLHREAFDAADPNPEAQGDDPWLDQPETGDDEG